MFVNYLYFYIFVRSVWYTRAFAFAFTHVLYFLKAFYIKHFGVKEVKQPH